MSASQLKAAVGISIVVAHFLLVLLVLGLFFVGGFSFEETTTTVALIVPMFGVYTAAIIKYIIANAAVSDRPSDRVTKSYVFISFFIPGVFILGLTLVIVLKTTNVAFASFEQFKIMLAVLQTALGAYMGVVLTSMFEIKETKRQTVRARSQ